MSDSDSALRPITLPSLPPDLVHLSSLKQQLQHTKQQIKAHEQLQTKLSDITDEPSWEALVSLHFFSPFSVLFPFLPALHCAKLPLLSQIPFGPLAYFPGKLVHTNDVTQTISTSSPSGTDQSSNVEGGKAAAGETKKVLRSAKKSRDEVVRLQAGSSPFSFLPFLSSLSSALFVLVALCNMLIDFTSLCRARNSHSSAREGD